MTWGIRLRKSTTDKLIFRVIEDPSSRLLAIQAGAIHGMEYPDPASFEIIENGQTQRRSVNAQLRGSDAHRQF